MSQLNESPFITVERRKAVTIIISAIILSLALGIGLMRVGSGFASRSSDGITVTGSAKTTATADNAVWILSVNLSSPNVGTAVKKVDSDVAALSKYLTTGGISSEALTLGPVSTYANEEYVNGNSTGRILSYRANRDVTVRTSDVQLVSKLSQGIGAILETGINVNNYGPQYYISNLPELRPALMSEAMKDAKLRAEALTKAVGSQLGSLVNVKAGPIQITTPDSTMTADYGAYDTSTIEKTVTATLSVTFKTN
ncbi:MAG: SIMPL domain-containing protein [Actinomycetota bacterium]|nr:SIMPL domain-containing protein [Actinomycetota bacterium]